MFRIVSIFMVFLFSSTLLAQDFSAFQTILDKNLVDLGGSQGHYQTAFDYDKAKKDSQTAGLLKKQLEMLKTFDTKTLTKKEQANAFYINAYNFFMIETILSQGFKEGKRTVDSVKDFGSWFSPYATFKKSSHNIGGRKFSLDDIEKKTLLGEEFKKKGWKDARIHFAVNCASVGCPPLSKKVYSPATLNKSLDENIKMSLKTPRHMHFEGNTLHLTHLFKWYKSDFEEASGTVKKFINKYVSKDQQTKVNQAKDIEYIDYSWKLNRPQNFADSSDLSSKLRQPSSGEKGR